MNDCKMYKMSSKMANQHTKKDIPKRLSMPHLHKTKAFKKAFIKATVLFIKTVIKLGISIFSAWLMSLWAIPAAYIKRGCYAVGGEWVLILAVFIFTYWTITKYIEHGRKRWKN